MCGLLDCMDCMEVGDVINGLYLCSVFERNDIKLQRYLHLFHIEQCYTHVAYEAEYCSAAIRSPNT